MRALIVTLVAVGLLAGGAYFYLRAHPAALAPTPTTADAPRPPPVRAEMCSAQDALYEYRRDRGMTMRLVAGPSVVSAYGAEARNYGNLGTLVFVVKKGDREFRFAAASSIGVTSNYLFPMTGAARVEVPRGVDLIQMSTFNTDMDYVPGLPRLQYAAPAHIYAPNLPRYIYAQDPTQQIEPIGFFDFIGCQVTAPPETTTTATTTATTATSTTAP